MNKTSHSKATIVALNGTDLDIETIANVAHSEKGNIKVEVEKPSLEKMRSSRKFILDIIKQGKPVYGINTGFGALSDKHIDEKDLEQLQLNLIRSHCTGVGKPFSREVTRAIMLLRANCLVSGHSGVTPEVVFLLLDFLNYDITPIVPEKGSVGASGDLAPLSHIALCLIGEGEVMFEGKAVSSHFAISQIGKRPVKLGPKDGLALINGTAVMAALGSLALHEATHLAKLADIASALTVEAVRGTNKAFDEKISSLKPHPGQVNAAKNLTKLLEGSEIINSHSSCHRVQDPYSLRCVPQVHGAARQTMTHAKEVLSLEVNAVTDNPLVFTDNGEVISGGNFHGEAVALCLDYLSMGLAELCSISERRIEKMMNPQFSELPPFLTKDSGLNSGLMIAQVTAAALTSENKILCHPASVDSIPTSTDKEDHVSMGVTAGRKLLEVIENLKSVLAIELLCSTQALEFLRPLKSTRALESVYELIRRHVFPISEDRAFYKDIGKILGLIENREIVSTVESIIGELS